jgi:hypothetical protein
MSDLPDDLPSSGYTPTIADIPRAGSVAEQVAFHDSAWRMVETYTCPSGYPGTRVSNAWLGEHGWVVQLLPFFELAWGNRFHLPDGSTACDRLARLAQQHAAGGILGTMLAPGTRPSAVYRMPLDADSIERFFEAHRHCCHMAFPPDFFFAVHANDGDFCTYAGPEAFIREALPAERIGPAATAKVIADVEA